MFRNRMVGSACAVAVGGLSSLGCRQSLLGTQNSVGILTVSAIESPAGAQGGFQAALVDLNNCLVGGNNCNGFSVFLLSGLLSDELTAQATGSGDQAAVDGRYTFYGDTVSNGLVGNEDGDYPYRQLLWARSELLLLVGPLATYEPPAAKSVAGEAYALAGYAELYMAENYCAGVTLDRALPAGGVSFGAPLSTDSLLGTAIGHFDSALAAAYQNDTVIYLASVGRGRAWLDRGQLDSSYKAVTEVPPNFVYNLVTGLQSNGNVLSTNLWTGQIFEVTQSNNPCAPNWNVADHDGGTGMNFVSAGDSRLALISGGPTCDYSDGGPTSFFCRVFGECYNFPDSIFFYPLKFGPPGQSINIPIATGVEAALIQAEVDLAKNGPAAWATDLINLRAAAPSTYLQLTAPMSPIGTDSTTDDTVSAATRVAVMFRERAFWLYGTGTRLGDMRREVRQYGSVLGPNATNLVYPNGPYGPEQLSQAFDEAQNPFPWQTYGTDVDLPLPTPTSTSGQVFLNPQYHGCTTSTKVP